MDTNLERLRSIKTFPSLVKYLRDELDWPIESDDVEDLSFDYEPEELGLDPKTAVKIKEIKQLRPFVTGQPWGIFFISFEPKRLPIVALRRILRSLVIKKRQSLSRSQQATWQLNDLLFISSYGESEEREISFAHFSDDDSMGDLPTLKVLGWNAQNTVLRLEDTQKVFKEKLQWPEDENDADAWRQQWSSAFKLQYRETVRTSKDLAIKLADLAILIRARVNDVFEVETESGELRKLYKAFQEALIHDLTEDDFADMYAQTIAYGLLTASISRQSGGVVADNLKDMVPNTNPFLKELMQTFLTVGGRKGRIDFDELGINEVVELLRHTQMDEVLRDFGTKNPQEDPVIHFYELFLKEYDPEKRMKRGVFYTPRPVVSFIVRSVDEILRREFGLEDGLADTTTWGEMAKRHEGLKIPDGVRADEPFVQILDPATGTGTFLVEVIDQIYATLRTKWQQRGKSDSEMYELWNDYVPRHLLPRLHGFELMMAPYAIAHMKIGLKLRETHYSFLSSERARIYLTNTLEEPKEFSSYFEQMAPALAHEAKAANTIKRRTPITLIIGNPPYSGESMNKGDWIRNLIDDYMYVDGSHLNERGKKNWLQDDYVKFIRFSQSAIDQTGVGVLGLITNHGYLDNPTFRGMRRSLGQTFHDIRVLDLHGNSKRKGEIPTGLKDENVFDIQQGVAVGLFAKHTSDEDLRLRRSDLWGTRDTQSRNTEADDTLLYGKYKWLSEHQVSTVTWKEVKTRPPLYLFSPQNDDLLGEYESSPKVTDCMPHFGVGIITSRDHFIIGFKDEEIIQRLKIFRDSEVKDAWIEEHLGVRDNSMWKMSEARKQFRKKPLDQNLLVDMLYRPFDNRRIYYETNVVFNMRAQVMRHMLTGANIGLCTNRQVNAEFRHALCTRSLINDCTVSLATRERTNLLPLYIYDVASKSRFLQGSETQVTHLNRRANLAPQFTNDLSSRLELTFIPDGRGDLVNTVGPEDVFHYMYSLFYSPAYRFRYSEFLKIDFPVPLTSSLELFNVLCGLGADLVALHLLEDDYDAASWNASQSKDNSPFKALITRCAGKGSAEVAKGYPKYRDDGVYINPERYFEGVSTEVWDFQVGGYQVCDKWLKDRRGRTLSEADLNHYQRVVVALNETIHLMGEIDRVIEEHGGWPLVGSQNGGSVASASTARERSEVETSEPLPFG
jgi:predicted helicase